MNRLPYVTALLALSVGCKQDQGFISLVGGDGELRFNLQFTNEELVDLDLHVWTPLSEEIYYAESEDSSGGALDVDCFCNNCEQGPNENIFWPYGTTPPSGTYRVWVEYYGSCDFSDTESTYTLRILEAGTVVETYTGTLDLFSTPTEYTHVVEGG